MTLVQFLANHNIDSAACSFEQSKHNTYEETDTPICWLQLPVEVDDQDFMVLSATAATKVLAGELKLSQCDARDGGIVSPKDVTTLEMKKFW